MQILFKSHVSENITTVIAVSYTHLDVYKRQSKACSKHISSLALVPVVGSPFSFNCFFTWMVSCSSNLLFPFFIHPAQLLNYNIICSLIYNVNRIIPFTNNFPVMELFMSPILSSSRQQLK